MGNGARQRMNYCWEIVSGHHAAKSDRERANGDRGLYRLLRISVPKQAGKEFCGKPCPFCGEVGKDRSGGHHQRIFMERIS
jgi:hypothetical protein